MRISKWVIVVFVFLTILIYSTVSVLSLEEQISTSGSAGGLGVIQENRTVDDVETAFDNLNYQGEWLGFYLDEHWVRIPWKGNVQERFELFPGIPVGSHIQGMARSPRAGTAPVFYFTASSAETWHDSVAGLMVVQMNSLATNGERLGSNRLVAGKDTAFSPPNDGDKMKLIRPVESHHPSGIAMVGDILAVPMDGRVYFYDCSDPLNPVELDYKLVYGSVGSGQPFSTGSVDPYLDDLNALDLTPSIRGVFYSHDRQLSPSPIPVLEKAGDGVWIVRDGDRNYTIFHEDNKIKFYDAQDRPTWSHGAQAVAITKIYQDGNDAEGRFILMTNDGSGAHFHWSNGGDFFADDFKFPVDEHHYRFLSLDDNYELKYVHDTGYWPIKGSWDWSRPQDGYDQRAFQNLTFINETGGDALYLMASCNSHGESPRVEYKGRDELYLLNIHNFNAPSQIYVRGVSLVNKKTRSPGSHPIFDWMFPTSVSENLSFLYTTDVLIETKRWQANFNAGATAYISPAGELLYYGASHYADGGLTRNANYSQTGRKDNYREGDFVKMAEYSSMYVSKGNNTGDSTKPGTCGPKLRENHLGGPYTIYDSEVLLIDGSVLMIEPWVRMYNGDNYDRESVMVDWRTQYDDDYNKFSDLDGEYGECRQRAYDRVQKINGFNNCLSSFLWCGPSGATVSFYKDDNYGGQELGPISGDGNVQGYIIGEGNEDHDDYAEEWEDFNNSLSSMKLSWNPPTYNYRWGLTDPSTADLVPNPAKPHLIYFKPKPGASTNTVTLNVIGQDLTAEITVLHANPSLKEVVLDPSPANAGDQVSLTADWRNPETDSVLFSVNWGDGAYSSGNHSSGVFDTDAYYGSYTANHIFDESGDYTIEVCVSDPSGAACKKVGLSVDNATQKLFAGSDQEILEGDELWLRAIFRDFFIQENYTATVDWGDGSEVEDASVVFNAGMGTIIAKHVYQQDGTYTVKVCVSKDMADGAYVCDTLTVMANNQNPIPDAGLFQEVEEGQKVSLAPASFSDAGVLDAHGATVNWGDGSAEEPGAVTFGDGSGTVAADHVYADNGTYTVTVCVRDTDMVAGAYECDTFVVTVKNVPPVVQMGSGQIAFEGVEMVLDQVTFIDKGTLDTHPQATIDWGDRSDLTAGIVAEFPFGPPGNEAGAGGSVTGSHQYLVQPGNYTVTVCLTDDDGATGCSSNTLSVVHGFLRFCAYAREKKVQIEEGAALDCSTGGMDNIDLKKGSTVFGSVISGGDVSLEEGSLVGGSVIAAGRVEIKKGATIQGGYEENATPPYVTQAAVKVRSSGNKITVKTGKELDLSPHYPYGDLTVKERATLRLSTGRYTFKSIKIEKDAKLQFLIDDDEWVIIEVQEGFEIQENVMMDATSGGAENILFKIGGNSVKLGKEASLLGTVIAPEAHIDLHEDAQLTGVLYAANVQIKKSADVWYLPAWKPFIAEFLP